MLTTIPAEILKKILKSLTNHEIYRLLVTCRYLYQISLPELYCHLKLGSHVYTRQLQYGIDNNPYLIDVILQNTAHLSLRSAQEGNNWRISDLISILGKASKISTLTLSHYQALSTTTIDQLVSILPHLELVEIKYSHLVYRPQPTLLKYGTSTDRKRNNITNATSTEHRDNSYSAKFKHLSLEWTEFTEKSITHSLFPPQITHLNLGSNRNTYLSNECMAKSIVEHCPNITHLTIALPQVTEPILCDIVTKYGSQLNQLSMRCDSAKLLLDIATHNTELTHLTLRVTPSANSKEIGAGLLKVVESCTELVQLEIYSCHLQDDIPCVIWEAIGMYNHINHAVNKISSKAKQVVPSIYASQRSVWFNGDVFEEVLQQRYYYNLIHGRKQQNNAFERLVLRRSELQKILY